MQKCPLRVLSSNHPHLSVLCLSHALFPILVSTVRRMHPKQSTSAEPLLSPPAVYQQPIQAKAIRRPLTEPLEIPGEASGQRAMCSSDRETIRWNFKGGGVGPTVALDDEDAITGRYSEIFSSAGPVVKPSSPVGALPFTCFIYYSCLTPPAECSSRIMPTSALDDKDAIY